jgi:hypothetical protein
VDRSYIRHAPYVTGYLQHGREPKRRLACVVAKLAGQAPYCRRHCVNLHVHDIIGYQGSSYRVEGILEYGLGGRVLRLGRLCAGSEVRYLEMPGGDLLDRALLLAEIPALDITTPPPASIYHGGESFLLKLSGTAEVTVTGQVPGRGHGACTLWRYRAAGGRLLQIEAWPDAVRMLEGASVHQSMIEVRPGKPVTRPG